jgi:hypothetical protein
MAGTRLGLFLSVVPPPSSSEATVPRRLPPPPPRGSAFPALRHPAPPVQVAQGLAAIPWGRPPLPAGRADIAGGRRREA